MEIKMALGAFGLGTIVGSVILRRRLQSAAAWPVVVGEVVASSVPSTAHFGHRSPRVAYRYRVDGRTFESDQVSLDPLADLSTSRGDLLATYPTGRLVQVHYDPDRPENAFLEASPGHLWLTLSLAGVLVLGVVFFMP